MKSAIKNFLVGILIVSTLFLMIGFSFWLFDHFFVLTNLRICPQCNWSGVSWRTENRRWSETKVTRFGDCPECGNVLALDLCDREFPTRAIIAVVLFSFMLCLGKTKVDESKL